MTLTVAIPFRSNDEWRRNAHRRVSIHLRAAFPDAEIVHADDGECPFSRGGSIMHAIRERPADVYLVCDADLIVPTAALREVVRLAGESAGLVIPFNRYLYLTVGQTRRIIEPGVMGLPTSPRASWTMEGSVGGAGAFSQATIDATGGYPPVFRGWGFEDEAFALLADELAGPTRRVAGDAMHLYHPVDVTNNPHSPGYQRNMQALQRLIAARARGHEALRAELGAIGASA